MPDFTFEIIERGKARPEGGAVTLPEERLLWASVEALALKMIGFRGAFIRVKNATGDTVARAGISTALSSIESCTAEDCPLKRELKHFQATGRHSASEPGLVVDCAVARAKLAA